MQGVIVDAVKVHKLRGKALKSLRQNGPEGRIAGQTIKEILTYLGIWEGGEVIEVTNSGAAGHSDGNAGISGHNVRQQWGRAENTRRAVD